MAGGEGAKERRRLKRLAAQEAKNKLESTKSPQKTAHVDQNEKKYSKDHSNGHTTNDSTRNSNGWGKQKFNKNKNFQNKSNGKNNAKKLNKPKIKKPKHLKRKLEQAAHQDVKMRETIQKEIEEFESKKKLYSKNGSHKRQKTTTHKMSAENDNGNEDAVERLNRINAKRTYHQTNEVANDDAAIKQPAVIENEGSSRMEIEETVDPKAENKNDKIDSDSTSDEGDSSDLESTEEITIKNSSVSITSDASGDRSDQDSSVEEEENDDTGNYVEDSSDSSDDSDNDEPIQHRQRGRRRRGRQDTAKKIEEMEALEKSRAAVSADSKLEDSKEGKSFDKEKKRYCIGRKPVTDFVIGQSYSGKVVYVKPFGVFFDIGCHSDAFCHVSRLSDDYIEKPESKFKEGDEIPSVRIVEIDRKQKRITVSLQSEIRMKDERKSIEDRQLRREKMKEKAKKKVVAAARQPQLSSKINSFGQNPSRSQGNFHDETTLASKRKESIYNKAPGAPPKRNTDLSKMTPAELKRARKLARRAERRAKAESEAQEDTK